MPELVALARKIKLTRRIMDLSQDDFAHGCGISVEELSKLERGRSNPKLSTLQLIAAFTGFTVSELLEVRSEQNELYIRGEAKLQRE